MREATLTAFAAAGLGRLIAQDSILREPRNTFLREVCGITQRRDGKPRAAIDDLGAACRQGIAPLELEPGVIVQASGPIAAKVAEGVTCPSCMSWYAVTITRLALDRRDCFTTRWWRDTFAIWGAAAILTRLGG